MKALILAHDDFELYSETRPAKRKPATLQSDPTRDSRMGLTDIRRGSEFAPPPLSTISRDPHALKTPGVRGQSP